MTVKNNDIRAAAFNSGIRLWEIANALSITDGNFSRKLRRELSAEEKVAIFEVIERLRFERSANEN